MPPTWVVCAYDGPIRQLLLDFKERGVVGLVRPLGDALARAVGAAVAEHARNVAIVPIPSASASVRRRGDDVVRLLARHAARRLRADGCRASVTPVLTQRRGVTDSAGLAASARAANLAGALVVRRAEVRTLRGGTVVLVDDLVTTGTTLTEATATLRDAGAHVIGAAAVAATRRNSKLVVG
jgi:predicted amidophosphoribosyltransferase